MLARSSAQLCICSCVLTMRRENVYAEVYWFFITLHNALMKRCGGFKEQCGSYCLLPHHTYHVPWLSRWRNGPSRFDCVAAEGFKNDEEVLVFFTTLYSVLVKRCGRIRNSAKRCCSPQCHSLSVPFFSRCGRFQEQCGGFTVLYHSVEYPCEAMRLCKEQCGGVLVTSALHLSCSFALTLRK